MNKSLLLFAAILYSSIAFAQLPYSKILNYTKEELETNHFKYDKSRNQYVLKKSNGLNSTLNVLNAMNGQTADIAPHPDDYIVIRQEGKNGVSSVCVVFYKDDTFHDLGLLKITLNLLKPIQGKRLYKSLLWIV